LTLLRLAQLAVPLPGGNRIVRARALISRASLGIGLEGERAAEFLTRLLEAYRTIFEFYLIVMAITGGRDSLLPTLAKALSGADTPAKDANTQGRDLQFESLVGALVRHSGIMGVSAAEPDFLIKAGDTNIGVAAKRITSSNRKKVRKRVSEAIRQLKGQGVAGVIMLGLDGPVSAVIQSMGHEAATDALKDLVEGSRNQVLELRAIESVYAVYGFATTLGVAGEGDQQRLFAEFAVHCSWIPNTGEEAEIKEFLDSCAIRLRERVSRLFEYAAN
jgi:hypothetical protein